MKRLMPALLASLSCLAMNSHAAADPAPANPVPPVRSALPPPAIDDPGVGPAKAVAETIEPTMPDTRPVRDKAARDKDVARIRSSSDAVTSRTEGGDTIEEYREKGRLRMIRIVPQNGPEQIYMDVNNNGRLDRDPRDGPVSPVYFTIYQWD